MIEYELTKKKYGLVWEEHEERVDEELKTQIPTFEEVKEKETGITTFNLIFFTGRYILITIKGAYIWSLLKRIGSGYCQ